MKLLVLGGTGMLGHIMARTLSHEPGLSVTVAARRAAGDIAGVAQANFNATDIGFETLAPLFGQHFDYCINCIGAIKQLHDMSSSEMYYLNASFPAVLANICTLYGTRLIHISTDCVFVGDRGHYLETDLPDARDAYGHSKFLGEQVSTSALVLRTSIVGPELKGSRHGLMAWFTNEKGPVSGYTNAFFSGVTTLRLSRYIADLVRREVWQSGLFHLAGPRISKYDLLHLFKKHLDLRTEIFPFEQMRIDRSLVNGRITDTGYRMESWDDMLRAMITEMKSTA